MDVQSGERDEGIVAATPEVIEAVWRARWGLPIVTVARTYGARDVEGLALLGPGGRPAGLVTWSQAGAEAELVTLDTFETGRGRGSRLLAAAEARLRGRGVRRLRLVTTNDNTRALKLFRRHGYQFFRAHLDAMDRVRALKPEVPLVGLGGIPLRDMLELVKDLEPARRGR